MYLIVCDNLWNRFLQKYSCTSNFIVRFQLKNLKYENTAAQKWYFTDKRMVEGALVKYQFAKIGIFYNSFDVKIKTMTYNAIVNENVLR